MANQTAAGGLRLKKAVNGAGQNLVMVYFSSSDATATGIGDPLVGVAAGGGSIGTGPTAPSVARATNSGKVDYIVDSFLPQYTSGTAAMNLGIMYRPASTAMYALARPTNNVDVYSITDDGTFSVAGATNIGSNANLVINNCSTTTGLSNVQLGGSTADTTATLQVKIVGVDPDPANDISSANAKWLVTINNAMESGGTGTVGI